MKIVIFAGGVGTRLWPLSRKHTPKQFEKIIGDKSTLQQTVERLQPEFNYSDIHIATGKHYEKIVMEQLPNIPKENFIFEPEMRDVGPAIGLVSAIFKKRYKNEPIIILWSDHLVKNIEAFKKSLTMAGNMINEKKANFIFIAQKPRFANQNIGWIELNGKINNETADENNIDIYRFKKLIYRPKLIEAEEYFKNENFVWNLGYFVTTPEYLESLFKKFVSAMHEQLALIGDAWGTKSFDEVLSTIYPTLDKISFDDAILVKLNPENICVISTDLEWSDVGAWEALKEALCQTKEENLTKGKVMLQDSKDCLVFNYGNQLSVGINLEGMLIINTNDVLLICPKNSVPKIKKLVESLAGTPHEHLT